MRKWDIERATKQPKPRGRPANPRFNCGDSAERREALTQFLWRYRVPSLASMQMLFAMETGYEATIEQLRWDLKKINATKMSGSWRPDGLADESVVRDGILSETQRKLEFQGLKPEEILSPGHDLKITNPNSAKSRGR